MVSGVIALPKQTRNNRAKREVEWLEAGSDAVQAFGLKLQQLEGRFWHLVFNHTNNIRTSNPSVEGYISVAKRSPISPSQHFHTHPDHGLLGHIVSSDATRTRNSLPGIAR